MIVSARPVGMGDVRMEVSKMVQHLFAPRSVGQARRLSNIAYVPDCIIVTQIMVREASAIDTLNGATFHDVILRPT